MRGQQPLTAMPTCRSCLSAAAEVCQQHVANTATVNAMRGHRSIFQVGPPDDC